MADKAKRKPDALGIVIVLALLAVVAVVGYFALVGFAAPAVSDLYQSTRAAFGSESGKIAVCIRNRFRSQNDLIRESVNASNQQSKNKENARQLGTRAYRFAVDLPIHVRSLMIADINEAECARLLRDKPEWLAAQKQLQEDWDKNAPQALKDRARAMAERQQRILDSLGRQKNWMPLTKP